MISFSFSSSSFNDWTLSVNLTKDIDLFNFYPGDFHNGFIAKIKPEILYIPFFNDIHSDHQIVSKSVLSSSKWFRSSSIKQINMYETLSETNFNFSNRFNFKPNVLHLSLLFYFV